MLVIELQAKTKEMSIEVHNKRITQSTNVHVQDAMTSQYAYRKSRNLPRVLEKALRYGAQPIYIPCGKANPGDHSLQPSVGIHK